jgi:hypothetical protein
MAMTTTRPIEAQGSAGILGPILYWVAAGFVLTIVGLPTLLGWQNIRRQPVAMVMMGIFWCLALYLTTKAVAATLRYARFGTSQLTLDAAPEVGGYLEGVVDAPAALMAASAVEVKLECLRVEYWTYHDAARRQDKHIIPVWRGTSVLDPAGLTRTAQGVQVPLSIALPSDGEPTGRPEDKVEVAWQLTVTAVVPGIDYVERFDVDVEPASAQPARPPARSMPVSSHLRAIPRGYQLARHGDGVRVRFPQQTSLLMWPALIVVLAALLAYSDGRPIVRRYHLGLNDWGGMALGAVFVADVVAVMAVGSGVDIVDDRVSLRRGPCGLYGGRTLPRAAVADVRPKPSHAMPPRYAIEFVTADGTAVASGYGLDDVEEAQALAAELKETARSRA